jgi:hypothetical protein
MAGFSGDPEKMEAYRRFIEEIEIALRAANRETIGKQIPELDKESFFCLAVFVAKLKSELPQSGSWEDDGIDITTVQSKNAKYNEAPKAFEPLGRTIGRGYGQRQRLHTLNEFKSVADARHAHVTGQGLDACHPRSDGRVAFEADLALVRQGDIGIAGEIGDGRPVEGQPVVSC